MSSDVNYKSQAISTDTDIALSPAKILDATEETIRRFGPDKANVVDVARALGVSHGSVYRHFATKAALREAVITRWLAVGIPPLQAIAELKGTAVFRLRRWLDRLIATQRARASRDPEIFAVYASLCAENSPAVTEYTRLLRGHLSKIISDGISQGEFREKELESTAQAVLDSTVFFHHPAHHVSWISPEIDRAFEAVWLLSLSGIAVKVAKVAAKPGLDSDGSPCVLVQPAITAKKATKKTSPKKAA